MLFILFERIFFQPSRASKLLLSEFLQVVLGDNLADDIREIQHQPQSNYRLNGQQLHRAFEVETRKGEHLSIQIQVHQSDYFHHQTDSLMFNFEQDRTQIRGKPREFLIHVLNFNLLQETDAYHHCYFTSHQQNFNHPDAKAIHYLELPKFTSHTPNTKLEKWLYFINQIGYKKRSDFYRELVVSEPIFKLADHLFNRVPISQNGGIVVKEQPLDLGEWKDIAHQIEKERIALNMIKAGFPYEQIIKLTDLSLAELDALALTIPLI